MHKNCLICFLCMCFFNNGIAQSFSYEKLKGHILHFTRQSVDLNDSQYYGIKLRAFGGFIEKPAQLISCKINDSPIIYHLCNESVQELSSNIQDEFLLYGNQKINLSYLLQHNANQVIYGYKILPHFTGNYFYFHFGQQQFMLLKAEERRFFRNAVPFYLFLLELKNDSIINSFAFADATEYDSVCFGDFNKDGLLDYIDWQKEKKKIRIFSLKGNRFVEDKKHYIIVGPTASEAAALKMDVVKFNFSGINRQKSRWFYPL